METSRTAAANSSVGDMTVLADTLEHAPEALSATCQRCREDFIYLPVQVGGQPLKSKYCSRCLPIIRIEEQDAERRDVEHAEAVQRRAATMLDLLADVGVNIREHGHCTLDNFETDESGPGPLEAVRSFVEEAREAQKHTPVKGLYLWGDTGPGKSHLAVAALRAVLEDPDVRPETIRLDRADTLIIRIQDTYGRRDDSTMAVLESRIRSRVWVLDDLGTERASDDVARHLTLIFSERALAPTIVTSNLSPRALEGARPELGRLSSRLGPLHFRWIEVLGRDRRFG